MQKTKLSEEEKNIIRTAVIIMKRCCLESKVCDCCPVPDVFCTGNRKKLPKDWKIPFRRKVHMARKVKNRPLPKNLKQLTHEDFNEIRRNDLLKGEEGRKVEQWLTVTSARSAKST